MHSIKRRLTLTRGCACIALFLAGALIAAEQPPVSVIVAEVKQQSLVDQVEALGTLKANESVELTATVTERVTAVNFTDGERVKQGELLVEMDHAEEKALLAEERSRLSEALKQVQRLQPLAKKNAATQSTLDQQQREVETARARMDAIQSRIERRRIVAPFDGVLGLRNISVGAVTQPGKLITTIDDDRTLKLDFSVPALFLSAVKPGLMIEARTRAFPERIFEGEVMSIDSRIDPITRSVVVRAYIDNAEGQLKPGLLMRVTLQANPRTTLMIPEEALIPTADKNYVFVIAKDAEAKDGVAKDRQLLTVKKREVVIGTRRPGEVEVIDGLAEHNKVVTHGTLKLSNNQTVTIRAEEKNNESLKQLLQSGKQNDSTQGAR